ncbi:MAG: 1-acyl-sn-glycerol-3-phosphate acyltransferase [Chloroflexi bacterium]|nr:MAG: 1-acyl-sn-glycerol-3-phosphate acyltransferase [Chloroflexota bacterium]
MRHAVYGLVSRFIYGLSTALTKLLVGSLTRWEIVGAERVPASGPIVLIANHLNLLDPPLVAASTPRRVHPMAKRELFETPLVGWWLWPYGAFPVRRFSADMGALRAARNLLRHDAVVLMFPEGTRSKDARMHPALPGAAMVALLANSPVVPVAITGTENIHLPGSLFAWMSGKRPHLRLEFGEPIRLDGTSDSSGAEAATDAMMRRIASMLPASYQGAYGPESAGQVVVARQEREAR